MKLNDVIARIPAWYAAGFCVNLSSAPGRGKTTVVTNAAPTLSRMTGKNIGLVVINGPLLTPADSIGYLVPSKTKGLDGREHMESVYTDPFWFRTREGKRLDEYDGGIIFVDEMDKADVDVKKVIGEAALSGRLGPHKLPEGWVVWTAGNRREDRSGSTKELDHLINRRVEVEITDDIYSWNDWADANGVSPLAKAFANQNIDIVFTAKAPKVQGPWCTPRSLVMADNYMQLLSNNSGSFPDDATTVEEVGGMIGDGAAAQFFSFVKLEREMPRFEDIVSNPTGTRVPEKPDATMLMCYNLAHRVDELSCPPVIDYVERLPKEFAVVFARSAATRMPKLLNVKRFMEWTSANSHLIAALSGRK